MALYNTTHGTDWELTQAESWGQASVPLGKWKGVAVNKADNVVKLELGKTGLIGTHGLPVPVVLEICSCLPLTWY